LAGLGFSSGAGLTGSASGFAAVFAGPSIAGRGTGSGTVAAAASDEAKSTIVSVIPKRMARW
jgi:hypothetical protein